MYTCSHSITSCGSIATCAHPSCGSIRQCVYENNILNAQLLPWGPLIKMQNATTADMRTVHHNAAAITRGGCCNLQQMHRAHLLPCKPLNTMQNVQLRRLCLANCIPFTMPYIVNHHVPHSSDSINAVSSCRISSGELSRRTDLDNH
jgi:hypothetical protein